MEDVLASKILDAIIELKLKMHEMDGNIKDMQKGQTGLLNEQKSLKYEMVVLQDEIKDFKRDVYTRFDKIDDRFDSLESEVGSMKDALLDVARTVKSHDSDIRYLKAQAS